ncbi:MAG TPA: hypothetical protein VGP33_16450 [Chloroflexota bacterium]|jgi:hypothetical protein|nr:hypothetical protein [Chloroflexota bacterium]
MTTSLRVTDASDLLKLLTQTTQDSVPDNPAEQLSDYVPAPASGSDGVALADGLTLPNTPHAPAYTYGATVAMYARAEWS